MVKSTKEIISIFKRITQGILITVLITFLIFWSFTTYGATYGCFKFLDEFFGMQGYESCGAFGFYLGLIIGIIVSIILIIRKSSKHKQKI